MEGLFFCRALAIYYTLLAGELTALVTGLDTDCYLRQDSDMQLMNIQ